ncbi:hypothetical protein T08_15096 [Trichinella sp. T8]|nr:hypothetical protein T08_15096 [Trichinella sp. T8]
MIIENNFMPLKHIARKWSPNVIIADLMSKLPRYLTELLISVQMLLGSRTLPGGCKSSLDCFPFPLLLLKSHHHAMFWKVPRQTNAYVSNKWPLKLPCAYLNTQGSSPSDTPLKRIDNG